MSYADTDSISDYAKDAVSWNLDNGIMFGNDDNTFATKANTTRAQATAVFGRIVEKLQ
ncbi:MAG: S-layer homology domain-containing protein [Hominilimicola sp.]